MCIRYNAVIMPPRDPQLLSLESVLSIFTGMETIPPQGFDLSPTLVFNSEGIFPTASTCAHELCRPTILYHYFIVRRQHWVIPHMVTLACYRLIKCYISMCAGHSFPFFMIVFATAIVKQNQLVCISLGQ